ncbi:glycerol kinase [Ameyamaea chiangmaiensis NBRC 103196]|uniref:ATP:glycerol 3-phosphotransferase n=1 Tax=Ameyamaea chiangmaiensis TaxID=442969 RepID=A0A850PC98_9PROT|nr:FGGY family carbohydrate kinase [Ameyamaea chiangmaiensis]MBS4073928.1 glycerol kinase [Ameyamaea chiangmaiensis]NVN39926.1 glycerol kinase [Ameyamaea chiangmaiensis]GBQ67901.1 glycerol kinase [Ameyamaea chiangmaiensis NBRC 103196]
MSVCLAIDQGTTGTKAYRWQAGGAIAPVGSLTHRQIHPRPGWVEHDPHELLSHIRTLIGAAPDAALLGLANQGETVVAWHATTREPLANAIVWQDLRTTEMVERLRADGAEALTLERAGLPLDAYFSASKLRWLLDHVPDARALAARGLLKLGTSDAWFLDCLTGHATTDVATASRTSLMDIRHGTWDDDLCALFGIPMECLPTIRRTDGPFGGVAGGPAIAASIVDQQASLYGHGCRAPDAVKITFGTGAFVLGLTGRTPLVNADSGLLATVAWDFDGATHYALDGGVLCAGAAVDWGRSVGVIDTNAPAWDRTRTCAERGLFFVPALNGLGAPTWRRDVRGSWTGLERSTGREDLGRAIWEGVGLRARQVVKAFEQAQGRPVSRLSIDGGLTRNESFRAFLADLFAMEVQYVDHADLTASGLLGLCARNASLGGEPPVDWRMAIPQHAVPERAIAAFDALTGVGQPDGKCA